MAKPELLARSTATKSESVDGDGHGSIAVDGHKKHEETQKMLPPEFKRGRGFYGGSVGESTVTPASSSMN